MKEDIEDLGIARQIVTSIRVLVFTTTICCVMYTLLIYAIGQTFAHRKAEGSLIKNTQGKVVGSELIAQKFTRPEYFWPRPSAVDFNASAAGGSNLSPTNPKLRERAEGIISAMGATARELLVNVLEVNLELDKTVE